MADPKNPKPRSRPGDHDPWPDAKAPTRGDEFDAPLDDEDSHAGRAGRIVHDERGNAIWNWVKETTRSALDSTSGLLKRLEVPDMKVEDADNDPLSVESDRDAGGGYDPYGSASPGKGYVGQSTGQTPTAGRGTPGQGGRGSSSSTGKGDTGGGYDPYGKSITKKPFRKP